MRTCGLWALSRVNLIGCMFRSAVLEMGFGNTSMVAADAPAWTAPVSPDWNRYNPDDVASQYAPLLLSKVIQFTGVASIPHRVRLVREESSSLYEYRSLSLQNTGLPFGPAAIASKVPLEVILVIWVRVVMSFLVIR